ncbi:MAG: hypothetical protein WGN25_05260 [Candidatus Electrothrix sp. GW3-4]|uniref:hypothetical protein n=1 Tax=Candidatus Electrothrix sp. GW3-4 TaxID=3126740 RepID=UPI0030D1CCCF
MIFAAKGYEFNRTQVFEKDVEKMEWDERVLVVHSPAHARQQTAGLEARLVKAQEKIEALTPPRGRGRRQISDEAELLAAVTKITEAQRVDGLLNIQYEKQIEQKTKYVGRGRGQPIEKKSLSKQSVIKSPLLKRTKRPLQSKALGLAGKHL